MAVIVTKMVTQMLAHCGNPLVTFSGIEVVHDWPQILSEDHLQLGQVTGVAVDSNNHVHIFHRGTRVWDARSALFHMDWLLVGSDMSNLYYYM